MPDRRAAIAIAVATLLRLLLAPLRILSPDEAYYLAAARKGVAIPDHPPLLRALLAMADRAIPGPIELRVRSIAAVLSAITAFGVVALAGAIADARGTPRRPLLAAVLASFGLMGFAGGMVTTPDAPFLAATAWMLAIATQRPRPLLLALLAAVATASKVAALVPVLAIAAGLWNRHRGAAIATLVGALATLPLIARSLVLQAEHALGRGALVSAPQIGRLAALAALVFGTFFLFSPPVLVRGFRARRALDIVPGGASLVIGLGALLVVSALASGRPPEPNWIAPAMLVVMALAALEPLSNGALALHVAPTAMAIVLFAAPDLLPRTADPLARTPRVYVRERAHALPLPPYAAPSWACVYENTCDDFPANSAR